VLTIKLSKSIKKQQRMMLARTTASLYPVRYSSPSACELFSIGEIWGSSAEGASSEAMALVLTSLKESLGGGSESTILIRVVAQVSEVQEVVSQPK
jgi:hypothetical protein